MAELLTVYIKSPKDQRQKWRINQSDFDAAIHKLWEEPDVDHEEPAVTREPRRSTPAHDDFVLDENGEMVAVNIIDPERRTSMKEIPLAEYDPDRDELWSTHPRFNK